MVPHAASSSPESRPPRGRSAATQRAPGPSAPSARRRASCPHRSHLLPPRSARPCKCKAPYIQGRSSKMPHGSFEGCQFTAHVLEALRRVWLIGGSLRPPEEGKWLNYNSLGLSAPSIFASRCLVFLFGKLSAVSYITWHAKPYRISRSAVACKHMCLELAYARVVSRGGPRGGQHGKDFRPPKKGCLHRYTTSGVRPAPAAKWPGLDSTLGPFSILE